MPTLSDNYNNLFAKRWALIAISLGIIVGLGSAFLSVAWNLVIFGFNIMYIISPLIAGFVETIIARRIYGRSTGAISALITFILINAYGWLSPGWIYPKEPGTLSIITIIALGLMIQAAFPILVNYILFVVVVGIFLRLISLPTRILGKTPKTEGEVISQADAISIQGVDEPMVSVPDIEGKKIEQYVGLVTGEAVAKEKEINGRFTKLLKMIQPKKLDDLHLIDARELAVSRMFENAYLSGADSVVEILIDHITIGGLQGNATIVTATGTAVIYMNKSNLF